MAKTVKKIREEAPVNAAGSGEIAGIGVGEKGEPGVSPEKNKYKKKNKQQSAILFSMLRRRLKDQLEENSLHYGYNLLLEAPLSPEQKSIVDGWKKTNRAEEISGHVIPKGQDRISFPIESGAEQSQPHPDVVSHLDKHGYQINDYRAGLAETKDKKRKIKIGKVLSMTNTDPKIKKIFENDPARAASRKSRSGMMVTISRHPHDIANMSTNQGWTSCMDMERGCNAHYLKDDVKKGTHVAYLHTSDDPNVENPIARIALKPFNSTKNSHTILRPESSTYGTSDNQFHDAVNKWSETNFPLQKGNVYEKDIDVYHDSGSIYHGDLDDMLNHPDSKVVRDALRHNKDKITSEHINTALNHPSNAVAETILREYGDRLTPDHIDRALSNPDVVPLVVQHHSLKILPKHMDSLIKSSPTSASSIFRLRPELVTQKHIDQAMEHSGTALPRAAMKHLPEKIKPHHIEQAMRHPDNIVRKTAIEQLGDKFKSHHVDMAFDQNSSNPVANAAIVHMSQYKKIKPHHIDMLMQNPNMTNASSLALIGLRDMIKPHHIDMIFQKPGDTTAAHTAMGYYRDMIKPHHIDMALQKSDGLLAKDMMSRFKDLVNPHHIDIAMKHPDQYVPLHALEDFKDNIKPHHIDMAMEHPSRDVVSDAFFGYPNMIKSHHMDKLLDRNDNAAWHGFSFLSSRPQLNDIIKPEHIEKGLKHPHEKVRQAAQKLQDKHLKEQQTFAGKQVFIVPSSVFNEMRLQKRKGKHWRSYLKENDYTSAIREYANKYPNNSIIIQCENTGAMMYARYGKK